MKRTRRVLFFTCLISAAIYITTESDFVFYLLLFLLIYSLISFLLVKMSGKDVTVKVSGTSQGSKDTPIKIKLIVENKSLLPVLCLKVSVKLENMLLETDEVKFFITSLWPREVQTKDLLITENHIGCIKISIKETEVRDTLGIVSNRYLGNHATECLIFPLMTELHISKEMFFSYDMESFRYSKTKKGADLSEVFDIREYREGDSIKAIHWKLSAKSDSMMIKVPSLPVENSLMVVLDNNLKSTEKNEKCADVIEQTVNLFMSISYTLIRQGLQHAIGWYEYTEDFYKCYDIKNNEDLYNAAAMVIRAPFKIDIQNTVERLINSDFDKTYASYIYVSCSNDAEKEVERLREYGEVYIYRPDNYK